MDFVNCNRALFLSAANHFRFEEEHCMKKHFAKQIFAAALVISFVCGLSASREREEEQLTLKPVIYLYPEEETNVSVTLAYDGTLTCT